MQPDIYKFSVEITFDDSRLGFSKKIIVELNTYDKDEALKIARSEVENCFGKELLGRFSFSYPSWANRSIFYVLYDKSTLIIKDVFRSCDRGISKLLDADKNLDCINVTHPKNASLLADINKINGTNYN